MVTFDFLWDSEANLLAINADLDGSAPPARSQTQRMAEYLMIVHGPLPEGGHGTLSVIPIHPCEDRIKSCAVIALPSGLDGPVKYDIQVESAGAGNEDFFARDTVVIDPSIGPAPASAVVRKWSVHCDDNGPYLRIADAFEDVPGDVVSDVYVSRRSGNGLYPAELGDSQAIAAPLIIKEQLPGAHSLDPDQEPPRIIDVVKQAATGGDHRIEVFNLKATAHVARILQDANAVVPKHLNHQTASLRSAGMTSFQFPADDANASADLDTPYRPALLDRIVIKVSPPVDLVFEDADKSQHPLGKGGLGVLVIDDKGGVQPDNGLLVDKVRTNLDAVEHHDAFDLVAALAEHGYMISPADLALGTSITVFLFATAGKRIEDIFRNNGSALRPGTFSDFCDAPDFFCATAGLVPDQIHRRTSGAIRKCSGGNSADLFRALCHQILLRYLDDERQFSEDDEAFKNLETWVEADFASLWGVIGAAFSPTIRELVRNGIDPGPMMLSPFDVRSELEEVRDFGRLLGQLRQAGLAPKLSQESFSDFDTYERDFRRLGKIKSDVIKAVRDLSHEVSLRGFLSDLEDDVLGELVAVQPNPDNRAQRYLAEQIETAVGGNVADGPAARFAERAGALLFKPIASDYEVISALVAKDIADPVKLNSDREGDPIIRDEAIGFMRGLSEAEKTWVNSDEATAPLIARWRWRLRQSIEKADRRVEEGG